MVAIISVCICYSKYRSLFFTRECTKCKKKTIFFQCIYQTFLKSKYCYHWSYFKVCHHCILYKCTWRHIVFVYLQIVYLSIDNIERRSILKCFFLKCHSQMHYRVVYYLRAIFRNYLIFTQNALTWNVSNEVFLDCLMLLLKTSSYNWSLNLNLNDILSVRSQ